MEDRRPSAKRRHHLIGCNSHFKRRFLRPHPLTGSKYFNKYACRNDLMHCMDHHGVYGVIFASITYYLINNDGWPGLGATQQQKLDTVNKYLERYYKKTHGSQHD